MMAMLRVTDSSTVSGSHDKGISGAEELGDQKVLCGLDNDEDVFK